MTSDCRDNADLYRRAKRLIPGGTQLLSKRPELYAPDVWPAYYRKAHGCEIIDLDGRRLIDMTTNGIGACLLGYADPDVNAAMIRQIENGPMCTLNPPQEVELAELLVELHPWAAARKGTGTVTSRFRLNFIQIPARSQSPFSLAFSV